LLASTPLAVGDVLGDASKPRANVGLLRWAALVDAATPWIEEAIRSSKEAPPADEVIPQVHTVLEVLKTLRTVTCESYADGDALITHAITEIHDVP
jgi:hypothetical protein